MLDVLTVGAECSTMGDGRGVSGQVQAVVVGKFTKAHSPELPLGKLELSGKKKLLFFSPPHKYSRFNRKEIDASVEHEGARLCKSQQSTDLFRQVCIYGVGWGGVGWGGVGWGGDGWGGVGRGGVGRGAVGWGEVR